MIERGTKGIDFLLRFSLFNVLPTLFEIVMVSAILLVYVFGWATDWDGLLAATENANRTG